MPFPQIGGLSKGHMLMLDIYGSINLPVLIFICAAILSATTGIGMENGPLSKRIFMRGFGRVPAFNEQ
jgi:hypothetical protein